MSLEQCISVIDKKGRVVIPTVFCKTLDVMPGDKVVFIRDNEGIRLIGRKHALVLAQELFRTCNPEGQNLSTHAA